MSLHGLQSAITNLIRLPQENRGDLNQFIAQFDLSSSERDQVRALADHAELNKYGNELASQRWDKIFGRIIRLFTFVPRDWIEVIWFERFEPQATKIEGDMVGRDTYTLAFIDFLANDPQTRQELSEEAPAFIFDLLAYLRAECYVRRYLDDLSPLPQGSALQHRAFQVVRLSYDIPDLIDRALAEESSELSQLQPVARPVVVLMLKDQHREFRMFEIDDQVAGFIEAEAKDQPSVSSHELSDEILRGMIDLGLCRPREQLASRH